LVIKQRYEPASTAPYTAESSTEIVQAILANQIIA
jgi:hypothetical protein